MLPVLPFSREQFFDVFARYNEALWPAPIALMVAAVVGVLAVVFEPCRAGLEVGTPTRLAGWILAGLWAWMGAAYHLAFFTRINPAAWLFGGAFVVAAVLFAVHAQRGTLRFDASNWRARGLARVLAFSLIAYALIGYPLLGRWFGHSYPRAPTFGLPCPTTIFTLGMLLLARRPVPRAVFVVPLAWCLVGSVAAFQLGVVQDLGLLVAAMRSTLSLLPSFSPSSARISRSSLHRIHELGVSHALTRSGALFVPVSGGSGSSSLGSERPDVDADDSCVTSRGAPS